MALWQVQLREWTGGNIKQVAVVESLVELDEPLTFTFRDENGVLLLAHLLSQDDQTSRYVVAPTSEQIVEQLKTGARGIIGALDQPVVWVMDIDADDHVSRVWVGGLKEIPNSVLPAADVMLYAYLAPMIRLRATGKLIEPGSLPARVVKVLVGGAEKAVRDLTNFVTGKGQPGRPSETHRSLYQLQAQQFAFRSFEVAFRPVDPTSGQLIEDTNAKEVVKQVENLLSAGLEWVQTGDLKAGSAAERQAILEAMRELSPPQGSPIERIEVTGRVTTRLNGNGTPKLSKNTRQLAGTAVGELRKGRDLPEYAVRVGHVGAVDADKMIVTVRSKDEPDLLFRFEEDFLDDVLDALNTKATVNTVAVRFDNDLWLILIEELDDPPSAGEGVEEVVA